MSIDSLFEKFANYITERISTFVAFLFFLFTAGAVYGAIVMSKSVGYGTYLLIIPAALGLIAYYHRGASLVLFVLFLIFFVIL